MGRYFVKFSYLGTRYRGLQKNVVTDKRYMVMDPDTIQGAIETAFLKLIPKCTAHPKLWCSSRTDAGVHAICNIGHIDLENKYNAIYNPEYLLRTVNYYLSKSNHDIRILECLPVKSTFRAKSCVKSRTYIYRFMVAKDITCATPILELWKCARIRNNNFDIERLKNAIPLFMGTKNFQTFSTKKVTNIPIRYVRSLTSFTIEEGKSCFPFDPLIQNYDYWNVTINGKSFLYKQIRRIMGSLFALANGIITEKDIVTMLQVPGHHNWLSCISLAPSHGLYLANVEYCQKELEEQYLIKYEKCPDFSNTVKSINEDEVTSEENINEVIAI